jgi:glycerophosphoryl diester phosphodiesterase
MTRALRALLLVAFAVACSQCGHAPTHAATHARSISAVPRRIEVQGHRGARAIYPEESPQGFAYALAAGVDTLELDLAVTQDGHLVVLHDLWINDALCVGPDGRPLTERPAVRSLTLAEIKRFDCGALANPAFPKQTLAPGTRVATLAEVFDLVARSVLPQARTVGFNVEMKSLPSHPELTPEPQEFARAILDLAREHRMLDRITIESFDYRMLLAVKALAPDVPIAALVSDTLPDLVALAADLHAEIVSPHFDWITAAEVHALHEHGVRVVAWTANAPKEWDYLVGVEVDGIISDDPAALIAHLQARGLR